MQLNKLKAFAQKLRQDLSAQIRSRLELALVDNSEFARSNPQGYQKLKQLVENKNKDFVVEQTAYFWFNRLCALRFMDVRGYSPCGIVSPLPGTLEPELLYEARTNGYINEDLVEDSKIRSQIAALLSGEYLSDDPTSLAYRLLLNSACNSMHKIMPFLFQEATDYTEYLLPSDLLSSDSILAKIRDNMAEDDCQSVEIIGWLYQYYISEKKDEIFADFKKNIKATPENIGPATQLFTPEWIVRYLVENSLGRLWMLNHPESSLAESMEYYIKPDQAETDFIKISSPEDLRLCDPCCGSGHMLTYAFDLLTKIYEEQGYSKDEIPSLILEHNLTGLEIDERAGELAAFALVMKARELDRRFFKHLVAPKICVFENIKIVDGDLNALRSLLGSDLILEPFYSSLKLFEQAKNYGSLIRSVFDNFDYVRELISKKRVHADIMLSRVLRDVQKIIDMSECLSCRYHVVVTNPPYMGSRNMNADLVTYLRKNFPDSSSDLFSSFIERCFGLLVDRGYHSMVTMQSWMFLSSFETLRDKIVSQNSIVSLCHMANMVMGIAFGTAATVIEKGLIGDNKGIYCFVELEDIEGNKPKAFPPINDRNRLSKSNYFQVSTQSFKKIPGSPLAYWFSDKFLSIFENCQSLESFCKPAQGLATADNDRFLRQWFEVAYSNIGFDKENADDAKDSGCKWFPYNKGGSYRRWYGNQDYVVNWENDGYEIKNFKDDKGKVRSRPQNTDKYFLPSVTWSDISSSFLGVRFFPRGALFDVTGSSIFPKDSCSHLILGMLCCSLSPKFISGLNPTMHSQVGDIARLPLPTWTEEQRKTISETVAKLVQLEKDDWDSQEISWNYSYNELMKEAHGGSAKLEELMQALQQKYRQTVKEAKELEEQNNENFIKLYGLEDEIEPTHPLSQVTLLCNPYYVYSQTDLSSDDELWAMQRTDIIRDFISFAVGCMFGRYSLDKPGLILGCKMGEGLAEYQAIVGDKLNPENSFMPDDDNIIPVLADSYFNDDIVMRFSDFLKAAFGNEHYEENLRYIEKSLNVGNKAKYTIRDYFTKEFYDDHVKRYKKRPIYWLFQSPKKNFSALIYVHRYKKGLVSRLRRDYMLALKDKLDIKLSALENNVAINNGKKNSSFKEIEQIKKIQDDIQGYESKILYELAQAEPEIILDDGVKVNYQKFGAALKKIAGL